MNIDYKLEPIADKNVAAYFQDLDFLILMQNYFITSKTSDVYHLPKKSRNFGWNVNGKINFVYLNGIFFGKTGFLER